MSCTAGGERVLLKRGLKMNKEELEAIFQSVLDDEDMFSTAPEKDFEKLIDDFIKIYEKTGRLISKFCKYYNFSKSLQESDNEDSVENIMRNLENHIQINSNFIDTLTISITNQINERRKRLRNNEPLPRINWNENLNDDGTTKKQIFLTALQTAKTDIDRMSGVLDSVGFTDIVSIFLNCKSS
jgi:hypothetical protein